MQIILPHQFTPRPYQVASNRAYFIHGKRFSIEVLHRRAGKSKNALNFILAAAMQRVGSYYHTFPELTQARRAIWNGIDKDGKRYLDHIPNQLIAGHPNNSDMRINLINGSSIQLAGADRYDALMGSNPAGIIFDEYSIQNPFAWHYLSPIITENGGWAKFIFTPRGLSHGWELYERNLNNPDWFVQKLDITQTRDNDGKPIITEDQIEARRREGMPEELIRQEFYVDFDVALAGAIFSKEIDSAQKDGRIKNFPIDSDLPVYTAWDIGRRDPTSIWLFQAYPDYIRMIAYYENTNQGMEHYLEWLRSFAEKRKLRFRNHYHIAPHDIKVHEWTNGQARIEAAAQKGWYFRVAPKLGIQDGINAVRMIFPRLMFHADNCRMGLNALKQYCSDNSGKPIHNFASHPADALRTMACGWHDSFKNEQPQVPYTMPKWNMQ
jgi:phage terminase large subunit